MHYIHLGDLYSARQAYYSGALSTQAWLKRTVLRLRWNASEQTPATDNYSNPFHNQIKCLKFVST